MHEFDNWGKFESRENDPGHCVAGRRVGGVAHVGGGVGAEGEVGAGRLRTPPGAATVGRLGGAFTARAVLQELQCAVCLGTLARPASLPCGHSFCRACLRAGLARAADGRGAFCCPSCRAGVPEGFSPKVNVALRRVVELATGEGASASGASGGSPEGTGAGGENTPRVGGGALPSPVWAAPPPRESPATAAAASQAALMLSAVELRSSLSQASETAGGEDESSPDGFPGFQTARDVLVAQQGRRR